MRRFEKVDRSSPESKEQISYQFVCFQRWERSCRIVGKDAEEVKYGRRIAS